MAKASKKRLSRDEARSPRRKMPIPKLVKRARRRPEMLPKADPSSATAAVLERLSEIIREGSRAEGTHSARLLERGAGPVAQKFGEEAIEFVVAVMGARKPEIVNESADVLYHMLVAWAATGVDPVEVWAELQRREELSTMLDARDGIDKEALRSLVGTSKLPI